MLLNAIGVPLKKIENVQTRLPDDLKVQKLGINKNHTIRYCDNSNGILLNCIVVSDVLDKMKERKIYVDLFDEKVNREFEPIRQYFKTMIYKGR